MSEIWDFSFASFEDLNDKSFSTGRMGVEHYRRSDLPDYCVGEEGLLVDERIWRCVLIFRHYVCLFRPVVGAVKEL